jgi:hypothetical protein
MALAGSIVVAVLAICWGNAAASTRFHPCAGSFNFSATRSELPPVYNPARNGGFYREIAARGTTCPRARSVVRRYIVVILSNRHFVRKVRVYDFRCVRLDTRYADEQNVICQASHGRRVRFHVGS